MSNKFKNKMQQYEVAPPEGMWDKIAAEIEDAHLSENFPGRLYEYQQTPPENSWEKIASLLTDSTKENSTIPFRGRSRSFFKYATAAVLAGLVAWSAFVLFYPPKKQNSLATKTIPVITTPQQTDTENNSAISGESKSIAGSDIKINQRNITDALAGNNNSSFKGRNLNSFISMATSSADRNINNLPVGHLQPAISINTDATLVDGSRYFTMINPDGYIVRISKKISDIICCLYNSPSDVNSPCKEQVDKWREKVAKAPINGTPGSFMDIVDFINCIEDN